MTKEYFRQPGYQPNGHFFGHMVRYHVARLCQAPDLKATHGFTLNVMPNTGLDVVSSGDRIRIWKATFDEEIPAPGDSNGRLDFCDQPQMPLFEQGLYTIQNPGKLVLLWDVDSGQNLSVVRLACPRVWESLWKSPETHWNVTVPHPALWVEGQDFGGDEPDFGIDLDLFGEPEE